jgi:HemK-related putative methylase
VSAAAASNDAAQQQQQKKQKLKTQQPFATPFYSKPSDPRMDHASSATWEHVYEPCEDSYLLMDALYADLIAPEGPRWLHRVVPPPVPGAAGAHESDKDAASASAAAADIASAASTTSAAAATPTMHNLPAGFARCLEVGPGSGIIISYLSLLLRNRGFFWAVDVNPAACATTQASMRENGVRGDVVQGDLTSALEPRLAGLIDVLVFNPPYVPTPPEELLGEGISRSWAGGERGREVLDQLLPRVQHLLSERGTLYLVLLACNDPAEVADILAKEGGFRSKLVLRRRAGREDLSIVRYWRPTQEELQQEQQEQPHAQGHT